MDDTQRTIISNLFLKLITISLILNSMINVTSTRVILNKKMMRKIELDLFKEGYKIELINHCMYLIKPIMYND